jgi:hypothetical protein
MIADCFNRNLQFAVALRMKENTQAHAPVREMLLFLASRIFYRVGLSFRRLIATSFDPVISNAV